MKRRAISPIRTLLIMSGKPFVTINRFVANIGGALVVLFGVATSLATLLGQEASQPATSLNSPLGTIVATQTFSPEPAVPLAPIEMTIRVEKPNQYEVLPNDLDGDYGDFFCEFLDDEVDVLNNERNVCVRRWKLYPNKQSDSARLPPIPIKLANKNSTEKPIVLLVRAKTIVIPRESSNLEPSAIKYYLTPIKRVSPVKIGILLLLALMILLIASWKRIRKKRLVKFSNEVQETSFERAIRELDALKASNVYLENTPEFYAEIDDIFRRYLSGEFQLNAVEMTSREIVAAVDSSTPKSFQTAQESVNSERISDGAETSEMINATIINVLKTPKIEELLANVLTKLDRVKFAKIPTTFGDAQELYSTIRMLVEQTSSMKEAKLKAIENSAQTAGNANVDTAS